jgi:hypothetical protein
MYGCLKRTSQKETAQVPMGHDFNVYQEKLIDMGLGMNPPIIGEGNGYEFCSFIMKYCEGFGNPIVNSC